MSSSRVHIGNIPEKMTDSDLYGFLTSADIHPTNSAAHSVTSSRSGGKSTGNTGRYIVLTFESDAVAAHAIEHINYLTLSIDKEEYQLNASPFIPDFRTRKQKGTGNIIIRDLPADIEKISLKEAYSSFGRVLSSYVKLAGSSPADGRKKDGLRDQASEAGAHAQTKVGYVMFDTDEEAAAAIAATDGKYLGNNKVHVEKFMPIEQRVAVEDRVYIRGIREEVTPQLLRERIEGALGAGCLNLGENEIKLRPDTRNLDSACTWTVLRCASHDVAVRLVEFLNSDGDQHEAEVLASHSAMYEPRGLRARNAALRLQATKKTYVDSKRNLSVFNLRLAVTREQLTSFFSQYGSIQSLGLPPRGEKTRQGDPEPSYFHANILFETVDAASNAYANAAIDEAKLAPEQRLAREGAELEIRYYVQNKGVARPPESRPDMTSIPIPPNMQSLYGAPAAPYYAPPMGQASYMPLAAAGYPMMPPLDPPM